MVVFSCLSQFRTPECDPDMAAPATIVITSPNGEVLLSESLPQERDQASMDARREARWRAIMEENGWTEGDRPD